MEWGWFVAFIAFCLVGWLAHKLEKQERIINALETDVDRLLELNGM